MKYRIDSTDDAHECRIAQKNGGGSYVLEIDGRQENLEIISADSRGIDFVLGHTHHRATYIRGRTFETAMILDGIKISVMRDTGLDEIVYKNSGKSDSSAGVGALQSPIPGKVVSVSASEGDAVKKGDVICVLEAMKMQVSVKAHKDGVLESLNVSVDDTIPKGHDIAEIS